MIHKETCDCCIRLVVVILTGTSEYDLGLLITSFPTESAGRMNNMLWCSVEMNVVSQ